MKDGLALISKIWSDLKEKECCKRVVNEEGKMEEWKQNWDKVFIWIKKKRKRKKHEMS
jgi:hypothetical protein